MQLKERYGHVAMLFVCYANKPLFLFFNSVFQHRHLCFCFPCRDPSEEKIVENFLEEQGVEESKKIKILRIVRGMGKGFFSFSTAKYEGLWVIFLEFFACSTFS